MYTFTGRVRYSETDPDGKLTCSALIDYLQDCSTFQSEDGGVGIEFMKEHGVAWIVNFWQIDIGRLPRLSERIRIGTSPYELKSFMGLRNFMIETENGERLINANSVWSLFDLEHGAPVRVLPEMEKVYELYPKFDMEYLPRKIRLPKEPGEKMPPVMVTDAMLDSNHHVNNGQYVKLAAAYVPEGKTLTRFCIEYRKQAHLNDVVIPVIYTDDSGIAVALSADNNEGQYAVAQFYFS